MICKSCTCGCLILPYYCLYEVNRNLKKIDIENKPELLNDVNAFILIGVNKKDGVLGEECFNVLCENIKQSHFKAQEYKKDNPSTDHPEGEFWFYLEDKWLKLLNSTYFQNMYANYLMWYYYSRAYAQSESSKDGDVQHSRPATGNDGEQSSNITMEENNSKGQYHKAAAIKYRTMFNRYFMDKNYNLYPCIPDYYCGCSSGCDHPYCSYRGRVDTKDDLDLKPKKTAKIRPTVL